MHRYIGAAMAVGTVIALALSLTQPRVAARPVWVDPVTVVAEAPAPEPEPAAQEWHAEAESTFHKWMWASIIMLLLVIIGIALANRYGRPPRRFAQQASEVETDGGYARGFLACRNELRDDLGEGGGPPLPGPIGIVR